MKLKVLGDVSCDLDLKVRGQIMYFLVNVSPPKSFGVSTSLCTCINHMMKWVLGNIGQVQKSNNVNFCKCISS